MPEALDSVFAQTCTDWELIIWDDQSTDGTAEICNQLNDDRVRYYCAPEHMTVGPGRNRVVHLARGEWLAFLDCDDIWSPNKLAEQSRLIDQDTSGKLGIVYGWTLQFYETEEMKPFDRWHSRDKPPQGDVFRKLIEMPSFISFSSVVLRRSAILEIGPIPPSVSIISDYFLILMVARNYLAACLTETCCWYRKHSESITFHGVAKIKVHYEVLEILDICSSEIDVRIANYRRRVHLTHIGLLEIVTGIAILRGLRRILLNGSLPYLIARPFAVLRRYIRNLPAVSYGTFEGSVASAPGRTRVSGDAQSLHSDPTCFKSSDQ